MATQPDWVRPAGGVAPIAPGESATVTQVLARIKYVVAGTQEREDEDANVTDGVRGAAGLVRGHRRRWRRHAPIDEGEDRRLTESPWLARKSYR